MDDTLVLSSYNRVLNLQRDLLDLYGQWVSALGKLFDSLQTHLNNDLQRREAIASQQSASSTECHSPAPLLYNISGAVLSKNVTSTFTFSPCVSSSSLALFSSAQQEFITDINNIFSKYTLYMSRCHRLIVEKVSSKTCIPEFNMYWNNLESRFEQLYSWMIQDSSFIQRYIIFACKQSLSKRNGLSRNQAMLLLESLLNFPHMEHSKTLCKELEHLLLLARKTYDDSWSLLSS